MSRTIQLKSTSRTMRENECDFNFHQRDSTKGTPTISIKQQLRKSNTNSMKVLTTNFNSRSKIFLLLFIFFMSVMELEGRPSTDAKLTDGQVSGEVTGGGSVQTTTLSSLLAAISTTHKTRPPLKLSAQDEELHHVERYPVAHFDFEYVKTPFIIAIWIFSAAIAKIGFHMTPKLHNYIPESCLLIVVGVIVGCVLFFGTNVTVSALTPTTFFLYMLPPIILDAGYFMPNRKFFDNLGTILLMAVVGTIFNIATVGGSLYACGLTGIFGEADTPGFLDTFLFASLIAAVDPVAVLAVFDEIKVNEILYIVVFGESLLNDAVTVVMYHMMEAYDEIGMDNIIVQDVASGVASFFVVALGGTLIGIIWGLITGFVTRFTHHVLVIEPLFVFVMAYLSYLNAEMFHMSGILAITFCGIVAKNYVESNITSKSQKTIKYTLKMLSSSSETIIFMFLGVVTVNNNHVWNTWFVVLTIVFCTVFRAIGVIIFSFLANRSRLHKLSKVDQFVMSYGGLRGAVAFALALLIDERIVKQKEMFVTTTIAVIYFTVFLQGITIKPLVELLNVKRANAKELTMNERIHERFMDHMMAGIEDIIGHNGNYNLRDKFRRFNDRFIRPMLIRDLETSERKFIKTYSKLTMRDAMVVIRRNPSTLGQIAGNESISALFRNYTSNSMADSAYNRANLEAPGSRNLDIHELDYYPSKRDIFDAEIHHLRIEQCRPYKGRRNNYSESGAEKYEYAPCNRAEKIRFRRYVTDRKHLRLLHQASIVGNKTDLKTPNLVSFDDNKEFFPKDPDYPYLSENNDNNQDDENDEDEAGLTFAIKENNKERSRSPSLTEDLTPIPEETGELPWKEDLNNRLHPPMPNEFPAWAENKDYLHGNSTTAEAFFKALESQTSTFTHTADIPSSPKTSNASNKALILTKHEVNGKSPTISPLGNGHQNGKEHKPKLELSDTCCVNMAPSLQPPQPPPAPKPAPPSKLLTNGCDQIFDKKPISIIQGICLDCEKCINVIEEEQALLLKAKKKRVRMDVSRNDEIEAITALLPNSNSISDEGEATKKLNKLGRANCRY